MREIRDRERWCGEIEREREKKRRIAPAYSTLWKSPVTAVHTSQCRDSVPRVRRVSARVPVCQWQVTKERKRMRGWKSKAAATAAANWHRQHFNSINQKWHVWGGNGDGDAPNESGRMWSPINNKNFNKSLYSLDIWLIHLQVKWKKGWMRKFGNKKK